MHQEDFIQIGENLLILEQSSSASRGASILGAPHCLDLHHVESFARIAMST